MPIHDALTAPGKAGLALGRRLFPLAAVFLLAGVVYATAGFHNFLDRDQGMYVYAGQQVLRGAPPYVGVFIQKGPLSPLLLALGLALGRPLGLSDVIAARLLWCLVGCVLSGAMYFLAADLLRSRRAGFVAAMLLLACQPLTYRVASGPDPKLPMLAAMTLSLALTARRRWFWAGLCGALAALTWQPTAIFPALTLFLALWQERPRRWRAVGSALAGMAAPVAGIVLYYAQRGALPALADGALLFNLFYLDRGIDREQLTFAHRALRPVFILARDYRAALVLILGGLGACAGLYIQRARRWPGLRAFLTSDPFAAVLLSLPAPALWSFVDFQGVPDFFIFLPYVALGGALGIEGALRWVEGPASRRRLAPAAAIGLVIGLLTATVWTNRALHDDLLASQEWAAEQFISRFGPQPRLLSITEPAALALTGSVSPTRFLIIDGAYDTFIAAREPGGLAGWLARIKNYAPQAIVFRRAHGQLTNGLKEWLAADYQVDGIGPWKVYTRKP